MVSPIAANADDLVFALIEIDKSATPAPPDAAIPGEEVTFNIDVSCSSTQTDCINMKLTDAMPAPLQIVSVSNSPSYSQVITGNSFVLTFTTPLAEGGIGLEAGALVPIEVKAIVPLNVDSSYDGQTVVNTAFVTVDNPESNVQDDAAVLLQVPRVLSSTITKTITPALPTTVPGFPGTPVTFDVAGTNTSNSVVDTLIIQDPAEPLSNAFDYLEVTGLTNVVFPTGANRVQFDWFDGVVWTIGAPAVAVVLPPNPALIKGVRLTFSSSNATKIAAGATGSFRLVTQTNAAVAGLVADFTGTNLASSQVTFGVASNTPVLASKDFTIRKTAIAPVATKTIVPGAVIGGQPVVVTVGGQNGGDFPIIRMTVTEPKVGTTSLVDQGISFTNWTSDLEWPNGATAASVSYFYEATGYGPVLPTVVVDTLPAPDVLLGTVRGFIVNFTGPAMAPGEYAVLPYDAATETVAIGDVATVNTINVEVETATATASADASDDLVRRSTRINTGVRKTITPGTLYAIGGASTLVSLPAEVSPLPPAVPSSTVGSQSLVVRDDDVDFWAAFDAKAIIATDVPANSTLTVRYLSGASWLNVPGAVNIVGPATLTQTLPAGVQGLEFTFVPTAPGGLLPPGFNVQPNFRVNLKSTVANPDEFVPTVITNTVVSEVVNPAATPSFATASADDDVTLLYVAPGGPGTPGGPELIQKNWKIDQVRARSADQAGLTISWGTGGVSYHSVVISDAAEDPATPGWQVGDTVFEAFDLVSIPAITSGMDSYLRYDAVQSVQLYIGGAWVPTATNPCAGTACYGTFPGYTLTATERANALGVRFVIVERPNRVGPTVSDPTAPLVGSGVAPSVFADRDLDLLFEVRDTRRSNGLAVLGVTREALYNTVEFGEVLNSVFIQARDALGVVLDDDYADDTILILDSPINVEATKVWSNGPLGVPPVGTAQQYFPTAQMVVTGRNASVTRVNQLSVAEPTGGTTPFDYLNLSDIVAITVPVGATATTVILTRGVVTTNYTRAAALALSEAALADVTAIEVIHTGRVVSDATTSVTLDTRLREFVRGSAVRVSDADSPVDNTVTAKVVDPGGTTGVVGVDNVVIDVASDDMTIENLVYGVIATKGITADTVANVGSPAIQYDESSTTALVTLTGQPTGNVRTTKMVFEDISPSFWNAFNFDSFGPGDAGPVSPVEQVRVDALVGVVYALSPDGNTMTSTCGGIADLSACWVLGTPAATLTLPNLGATPLASVRGLRFTYTKIDQSNWENPYNPIQAVKFTVQRRDTLIIKRATAPTNVVPSTLFGFDPPPGETASGTYTNRVDVTASGGDTSDPSPLWSATDDDSKQIRYQHLPARVEITKSEYGAQTLGVNIPYKISVINRGGVNERDLGNVVVTDVIPVDAQGAFLVIPDDPDTGLPFPAATAFTYTLRNQANVLQPAPTVNAVIGPATIPSQTLTFSLVSPARLPKGWTLTINATLQLRPQLATGINVVNSATVTSDQIFDSCDSYVDVVNQNVQTNFVNTCTSSTTVWALASAPMTIVKGVRGVDAGPLDSAGVSLGFDDLGILKTVPGSVVDCSAPNVSTGVVADYYRFPCVPITRPGGVEEWVATFTNGGNIDVSRIAAIDVLPRANDRGVIVNEARGSKWTPILSTLPTLVGGPGDATLTVYYISATGVATTRCNATDIQSELGMTAVSSPPVTSPGCLTGGAADDLPQRNWQVLTQVGIDSNPALLPSVVALKFVVNSASGLAPGQKISILYRSITAPAPEIAESANGLNRDSIAYNSIAAAALGDDNGTPTPNRFVIEPRKVGVAMATGGIELQKILAGANAGASYVQSNFNFTLACTSVGQSFTLKNSDGTPRNPFTITAGAVPSLIQGLPLYARCTIAEGNYGSVQTVAPLPPAYLTAQAAHTTAYLVYNPNPAFDVGPIVSRPPIELGTVTNTYNLASLVVGKTIGINNAVNASGSPIVYSNFRFSATCTFFNGVSTVTVLAPTAFGLNDGQTRTFAGLPAGASCTVTETNRRGAISTSVTTTIGSTVTGPTTVSSPFASTVVLAPDGPLAAPSNLVQYTNNFGVGALTLNKLFSGLAEGTYATGTFTANISCTVNTGNGVVNVWSGTRTFSKATVLTNTINNIAVGAVCVITEPGQGGATSVLPITNATIVNATTVTRNITNVFDYAQLRLTKEVFTTAADQDAAAVLLDSPFQISVACTFLGASVYALGYSAGVPMAFSLNHLDSVLLTQLPSGASCTVTEVAPGNALSTNIGVTTTAGATANPGLTTTFTLTRDVAGVGTNAARVNNLYGVSSLTVTKDLKGGGAAQFGVGPFIVHVTCIAPGNITAYDGDISLSPTTLSVTIQNIAKDSVCSVEETNFATTGANAIVYRDGVGSVFDGTGVNVTDDVPSVTIENWYLTGEIVVDKSVGGSAGATFGSGPFEVTLECTLGLVPVTITNATRAIVPGFPETFSFLPDGSDCTLRESDTGGASLSVITRAGDLIPVDASMGYNFRVDDIDDADLTDNQSQAGFGIQNDFEFAELSVSKTVTSDAVDQNGTPIYYGPFPISVDCVFNGNDVYAAGYDSLTPMQRDLEGGDTWLLEELPQGADCTVVETDTRDAVNPSIFTVEGSAVGTTTAGDTATLTLAGLPESNSAAITNPYDVGRLELSKALAGAGASDWGTEPFTISVVCELDDGTGTRTVWDEQYTFQQILGVVSPASVALDNIAAGASCTIDEIKTGGANSTQVDIDGSITAGTTAIVVIPASTDPVIAVVTNTFDVSEIDVSKLRDGLGATLYGDGPFQVSLACTRDVDGVAVNVPIPGGATRDLTATSLPVAFVASYTGLPTGADCTMTETLVGGAEASVVAPGSFILGSVASDVTITNTFGDPSVIVRKALSGNGVPLYGAGPFTVTLECTREVNGATVPVAIPGGATRDLTGLNGYENRWDELPSSALCELSETTTGGGVTVIPDPIFVLGTQSEVRTVDFGNTFELAQIRLAKQVIGTAAASHLAEDFEVELACVLPAPEGDLPVVIPGGAQRTIRAGEEVVYEDLPANADCELTETKGGGATAVLLAQNGVPLLGSTLLLPSGESGVTMSNVFTLAFTGFDMLLWMTLAGGLLTGGILLVAGGKIRRRARA